MKRRQVLAEAKTSTGRRKRVWPRDMAAAEPRRISLRTWSSINAGTKSSSISIRRQRAATRGNFCSDQTMYCARSISAFISRSAAACTSLLSICVVQPSLRYNSPTSTTTCTTTHLYKSDILLCFYIASQICYRLSPVLLWLMMMIDDWLMINGWRLSIDDWWWWRRWRDDDGDERAEGLSCPEHILG